MHTYPLGAVSFQSCLEMNKLFFEIFSSNKLFKFSWQQPIDLTNIVLFNLYLKGKSLLKKTD